MVSWNRLRRRGIVRTISTMLTIRQAVLPIIAAIAALGTNRLPAQQLSPVEQRMQTYIEAHRADAVALLAKAVNIKSQTLDTLGVRKVGDLFAQELKTLGFETRWVTMPPELHRAGHLIAEHRGTKGKRLLLIGHLDTVLEDDSLRWVQIDSATAKGSGSSDMKGGDVAITFALKAMQSAGVLEGAEITVVMTGDEEAPAEPLSVARRDLIDAAKKSDVALAFEGGNKSDATVARRGASFWQLTVTGKSAHSAGMFASGTGYGAIYEAARILDQFRVQMAGQPNLTFSPSVIVGGTDVKYDTLEVAGSATSKLNIVASKVTVSGDLRFLTQGQLDSTRATMRGIVAKHLDGTSADITFKDAYPAMSPTPGNDALLAIYDSASKVLGYGPVKPLAPGSRGAGDISFVAFIDGLDGLGAGGSGAHTPAERVTLGSLPMQTERAALLFYRLTTGRNTPRPP